MRNENKGVARAILPQYQLASVLDAALKRTHTKQALEALLKAIKSGNLKAIDTARIALDKQLRQQRRQDFLKEKSEWFDKSAKLEPTTEDLINMGLDTFSMTSADIEGAKQSIRINRQCELGICPPEFNQVGTCAHCGPVPLEHKTSVDWCPWCHTTFMQSPIHTDVP